MSFLKAFIAALIWTIVCIAFMDKGVEISNDMQVLTMSIVIAGALAGGDK